jgi:beta-mannosidase
LDYFGRWKALHYAARRFYAPLMLSIEDDPPCHSIFVSSDLREKWQGTARWSLETLDGNILSSGTQAIQVAPWGVTALEKQDCSEFLDDDTRRDLVFIAELWQGEECLARQTAFFVPTKHLLLVDPHINAKLTVNEGILAIELSALSLARLVECSLTGADVVFSDNYFDLPAQKVVSISTALPTGWNLAKAQAAFKVRSVYDTYSK